MDKAPCATGIMTDQTPDNSCSSEAAPVIEGFRVLENLGRGATSSVWKAEQVSLNRLVVIKVLSERLTHEPEDVTLFKAEARMAANFKHAGIVQVYDFGQSKTGRRYYFVMEYISGYSVGDWIRRKGKITEHEALVVAQAVADALKYAWDLSKIVHCDIKPDNIMVDGDGSVKVADLGLAHTVKTMTNQPGAETNEVIITGTPNYMAPEQVRGSDPIDCRTDIYALGASLYHMVTGQLPFGDSSPDIVLERQLQEAFEYPQKVNPDLSTTVTRLIIKMTAKEPKARFQTWDEVLAEVVRLERQMRHRGASVTQPPAPAGSSAATATVAGQPPSADSKKDSALAGNTRGCPYCGNPIQLQTLYCGFCGKSVTAPVKEPVEDQKQVTIRLKPIQFKSPANGKSITPPPAPRPRSASGHWYTSWGGNLRMVLSLCLLAFLGYYAYQKIKYDHDVIIPIKAAIIRAVQSVQEKNRLDTAPDETPALPKSSESKPVAKSEAAQESELSPPPAAVTAPEATETAISATPKAPVPSETPPASEPPKPEPSTAPVKSPQDVEYERILQTCKQQQPKAGDRITLRFKNDRQPVEGVFEQTTAEGVKVKVPAGVIEYPFRLMSAESRLMYFPEEHARRLQRQKIEQSE
ncbi:MAG: protein kinase [Verrucomicrobiota bacterium]